MTKLEWEWNICYTSEVRVLRALCPQSRKLYKPIEGADTLTFNSIEELYSATLRGPVNITEAEYRHLETKRHQELLMEAARQVRDRLTDWETLRKPFGNHAGPDLLALVWHRLPADQRLKALSSAWVMCDAPEKHLPRREWLPMFRAVGYHEDDTLAEPPARVTLWRGGIRRTGMAWTADRERAEWFQHRWDAVQPGKLWTLTVGPERLLAHYHEQQRGEDEYVIDPTGIRPREVLP